MGEAAIPAPPELVTRFLSTLRLPPGSSEEEVFAAQEAAMREEPWPPVGELRKRVPLGRNGGGPDADVVLPACGEEWPVVVFVHGGGWVAGSPGTHRRVAHELAARGFATIVPRYRLAPGARYPAQLDDCDAAIEWALENAAGLGGDPSRLALAGDSAGAHLAAATAIRRRLAGRGDVGACLLLTGIYEYHDGLPLVGPHGWDGDPETQPLLDPGEFEALRADPVVNPLLGATALPPTFVGAGALDPFAPQARRLFDALARAGIPAALDWCEGAPHLCYLLPGLPDTAAGLDRAASWTQGQLARGGSR